MKIALAQINTTVGDLEGNFHKMNEFIAQAGAVDIIVFPELALTGYPPEDLLYNESFLTQAISRIPGEKSKATIIYGAPVLKKDHLYNAALISQGGKLQSWVPKQRLPNYGVFDEMRYFTPGGESSVFEMANTRVGITVCEDIWLPGGPADKLAAQGAQVILNLSASPYHWGKEKEREAMLSTRARDNLAFVIYCNLVGGQDSLLFDGNSLVIDPSGDILTRGIHAKEELIIVEIDPDESTRRRLRDARYRSRTIGSNGGEWLDEVAVENEAVPAFPDASIHPEPHKMLWDALVLGIRDYVQKVGFEKVILGLSGGLDSAVVACLAADALGPDKVTSLGMPTRFNSSTTKNAAQEIADKLGIGYEVVPIQDLVNSYPESVKPGVAGENLQARIRGTLLMGMTNAQPGLLLLTTGNKSELSVGYATLYGDTAGGFAPLADIYKSQLYELALWYNRTHGEVIPHDTLEIAPSAELREDQEDTDSLPAYEDLDPVLKDYIEKGMSQVDLLKRYPDFEWIPDILRMVDRAEYKRRQYPPGLKVSPRAYGRDRRMPIVNRFKG